MVWFFSKKSEKTDQVKIESLQSVSKSIDFQNIQRSQSKTVQKPFRLTDPTSIEQIQVNIFKSCVTKCLKQNNSNLQKTDSIHVAVYHCMSFCGGKYQNAIEVEKQLRFQ